MARDTASDRLQFISVGRFFGYVNSKGNYALRQTREALSGNGVALSYDVCADGMPVARLDVSRHELSDTVEETAELTFMTEHAFDAWKAPPGRSLRILRGKSAHAQYLEQREFHDGERIYGGVSSRFPFEILLQQEAEINLQVGVNKK